MNLQEWTPPAELVAEDRWVRLTDWRYRLFLKRTEENQEYLEAHHFTAARLFGRGVKRVEL